VSKGPLVWAVSLALLASVALAPTSALAQRGGGMSGGGMSRGGGGFSSGQMSRGGGFVAGQTARGGVFVAGRGPGGRAFIAGQPGSRAFVNGKFVGDSFHRGRFFHRPFNSFGSVVVFGGPYWPYPYYGAPYPYYPEPSPVYAPPAVYDNPYGGGTLSLTPPAPPTPSVVQFPTGRYELRGDGITEPYRWVWIPNPPTEPPVAPPPADPLSPVPQTDQGPTRHGPLYRWTDEQGTVHYTDRLTAVPDRYRAQAKRGESS
jgi:hypothetical protein